MLCQSIQPKWTIKEEKCSSPCISYPFSAPLLFRTTLHATCRIQRLFDSVLLFKNSFWMSFSASRLPLDGLTTCASLRGMLSFKRTRPFVLVMQADLSDAR